MSKKIDARGLACPQPVVLTKKALEESDQGSVEVTVDNEAAVENVSRMAKNTGCTVDVKKDGNSYIVKIEKGKKLKKEETAKDTLSIFIGSGVLGRGDDSLGKILIRAFFPTLLESKPRPNTLIFMNSGVKLTVEGSEVLDSLKEIEKEGIEILICGTCLDFFNIKGRIKVGKISNMFEIVNTMLSSDKIVTI
jgi:selenium metabolism protein YedF